MVLAKVTSLFGGLIYGFVFALMILFARSASFFLEKFDLDNRMFFATFLALVFLVSVINFCYSFYVQFRDSYHESFEGAFFYSLQLLIAPLLLFIGLVVAFISLQ